MFFNVMGGDLSGYQVCKVAGVGSIGDDLLEGGAAQLLLGISQQGAERRIPKLPPAPCIDKPDSHRSMPERAPNELALDAGSGRRRCPRMYPGLR